jgi:hypothetical protein
VVKKAVRKAAGRPSSASAETCEAAASKPARKAAGAGHRAPEARKLGTPRAH